MLATNIDEVIGFLHQIIDAARRDQSRLGYFAALYMHVATRVKECIEEDVFENPAFIEQLNLHFFNRYFVALNQYRRAERPPESWLVVFEAAESSRPTLEQHLLLGINAHINFDLGVAVAQTCPSARLADCRADYDKMTAVLLELYEDVMRNMAAVSPLLRALDAQIGGPRGRLVHAGLHRARQHAWSVALRLAGLAGPAHAREVAALDRFVAGLGRLIWRPGPLLAPLAALMRLNEHGNVAQIIDLLVAGGYGRKHPRRKIYPLEPNQSARARVAVLGGGLAGLVAAFELTDPYHNPRHNEYEVTVYQLGWRLGGKGASGRSLDPDLHYRIEEHGLHAWFGFYDNAFNVIKRCYDQLDRPHGAPLATWREAFAPLSDSAMVSRVGGVSHIWPIRTPTNDEEPGTGGVLLPLRSYVAMAVRMLRDYYRGAEHTRRMRASRRGPRALLPPQARAVVDAMNAGTAEAADAEDIQLLSAAARLMEMVGQRPGEAIAWFGGRSQALARALGRSLDQLLHMVSAELQALLDQIIVQILEVFVSWLWDDLRELVGADVEAHRVWVAANFIYANVRGIIADDVFARGFDAINDHDYRAWLGRHAHDDGGLMLGSELVGVVYDSSFAYLDGQPSFEAGTALRGLVRTVFTYKGAFGWKMQAGTGDVLFAPLYEVLRRRGVKFKFFHKVKRLVPGADGAAIERIVIGQQVRLRPDPQGPARAGEDAYRPLIDVKGLPCWPSEPLYDQIEDGDQLRAAGVNLESPHDATEAAELTLERGADFDKVVLGISLAGLPSVCGDLIAASDAWRDMTTQIKTVATQSLQLWLRPTASELGWPLRGQPIMTFAYAGYDQLNPLNSWGNLSQIVDRECWPSQHYPLSIAYFCSALDERAARDHDTAGQQVRQAAIDLLDRHIAVLWPNSGGKQRASGFDWSLLVSSRAGKGAHRLDSQYWRANTVESERYVLSVPGSSRYRLPAHTPGQFDNLYLAGDWTANGLNCGCMEAATISGRLASAAICGYPLRHMIVGVDF